MLGLCALHRLEGEIDHTLTPNFSYLQTAVLVLSTNPIFANEITKELLAIKVLNLIYQKNYQLVSFYKG